MMKKEKLTNYNVNVKVELWMDISVKSESGDIGSEDVLELITPKMIQDSFEECKRDLGSDIISIEECYDEDTYCCP